ncbi:uncharacterized protein LOC114070180 [Empidonax traillii]|uniref:uncharacterized protein LOC114070180 n=1 Tax=Empidonax traillii TaxID=164674 RepID=UPI000FFD9431|nr:uncharacterized protein LOC114070180 [Empidonax traillii]
MIFGNQLAKELEDWRRQQPEGLFLQYVDDILIAAKSREQCIELTTIEETYSSRPDLKDEPLENPDWELYTDGSSFMRDGKWMTGYAVTTRDEVIEAKALPADVSSQKAELIALTRALELSEGDWVYIKWWDSDLLRAKWRGPFQILLTSLTAVKVAGKGPWFHYSRVKKASVPGTISKVEPDSEEDDVAIVQNVSKILHKDDCWICTQIPAIDERLKETVRKYTDLDVEAESGKLQLALIFMGQSQEDIRKKLQKLEGEETRNLEKLLEVAWKVYNNREKEQTKKQQATTIVFEKGRVKLEIPEENVAQIFTVNEIETEAIPQEIEHAVVPWVWETGVPGLSKAAAPGVIELKEGAQPVRIKQYPISLEARRGVAPLIKQFVGLGILKECESEFNTPIFPVRKPNRKYRLVQDLRAVNLLTKDIHPVVANPYTLLTSVSEKFQWFSVIDLKDAFFCIQLAPESWHLFAFEWEDPDTWRKRQLTWTRLPQGFKSSPTIFGNQLAKELEEWKTSQVKDSPFSYIVLQYVDDILLGTEGRDLCCKLTIELLNMLGQAGYRVSKEKVQLVKQKVIYLGCEISQGVRRLGANRVKAICAIPVPRNNQESRYFLGMVGWCRLWIPDFGLLARPLYEAVKEPQLVWRPAQEKAFQDLKKALREAPALGLPDITKDFQLYVCERQWLALGVLTQRLGSWKRPVGYFSKQLDTVSGGWPGCLRAVAATVILIQEARKLILGRHITVYVPHMVIAVLEQKGGHWLSSRRMLQYQALLREQDDIELKVTNHLNPAEFLRSAQEEGVLEHDCMETIEHVYASRKDLKDEPLENPDWELFTDGSSFVENGTRYAGYAVNPVHDISPGDQVYVKNWSVEPLKETWDGPRQVLMTTYTAVKVEGIDNWIHYTRVKKVPAQWVAESITPTGTVFRAVQ